MSSFGNSNVVTDRLPLVAIDMIQVWQGLTVLPPLQRFNCSPLAGLQAAGLVDLGSEGRDTS